MLSIQTFYTSCPFGKNVAQGTGTVCMTRGQNVIKKNPIVHFCNMSSSAGRNLFAVNVINHG